jgi:polysaccharide pyruvyl transferase WcaK-like protein
MRIKKMNICLSGYYFVGSRGDETLREIITKDLKQYGKVRVIYCEDKNFKKTVEWCDVFVLGGGTLINQRGIGGYEQVKYAKSKGKKLMLYANTIEDGDPNFPEFLKNFDTITVRDSKSHILCSTYNYHSILAADPAIKITGKRTIHIGLRKWVTEPEDFTDRLALVIDELGKKYDVIFTPYTTKPTDTMSDVQFSKEVMSKMRKKIQIRTFKDNSHPDLFIGMRYHSIISTVKRMVPTIAINYDGKVGNFMSDIKRDNFLIEYNEIEKIPELTKAIFFEDLVEREKRNIKAFRELMKV